MARSLFLALFASACIACACLVFVPAPNARADIAIEPEDEYRMGLGLQMSQAGARVISVAPRGMAQRRGIRRGDLILAVDRVYIRALTPAQRQSFATRYRTQPVRILLVRNGRDVIEVRAAAES